MKQFVVEEVSLEDATEAVRNLPPECHSSIAGFLITSAHNASGPFILVQGMSDKILKIT